jgi:RHS repeat-associated protein
MRVTLAELLVSALRVVCYVDGQVIPAYPEPVIAWSTRECAETRRVSYVCKRTLSMPVPRQPQGLVRSDSAAFSRTLLLAPDLQQTLLAELDRTGPNRLAYTPYGSQSSLLAAQSRLGFNGQLMERPTGWYHLGNGHRVYNPVLMRFHSPDRLSPFGKGGVNAYAYCGGSPMNRVDPCGAWWVSVVGQAIGTFVGGLFAGAASIRTANAIVSGQRLTFSSRLADVLSFHGGTTALAVRPLGLPAAASALAPGLMQVAAVGGNAISQALTFSGGVISNVNLARTTLARARDTGQSLWRVAGETVMEVSGINLVLRRPIGQVPHRVTTPDVPLENVTVVARNIRTPE